MRVAGFGFRAGATAQSLRSALDSAGGPAGLNLLAAPHDKAGAPGLTGLAQELCLPVRAIGARALQEAPVHTRSDKSIKMRGTGSVAEAAALAAAGPGARLLAPRAISADRMATCAIATGEET